MEISEELIQRAIKLVDPEKKKVNLVDLQRQLGVTFYESLDVRRELIKRGIVEMKEVRK